MPRAEAREAPGDAKSYNELEWVIKSELTLWKGCVLRVALIGKILETFQQC